MTGSGALILGKDGGDIYINSVTFGEIEDLNIKDANNMGAAMAPAAAGTLLNFFKDTETKPDDYDIIFTGDLGYVGTNLLYGVDREGIDIRCRHSDCGTLIFDREKQDVHAGGSGCGSRLGLMLLYYAPFGEGRFRQYPLYVHRRAYVTHIIVPGRKHTRNRTSAQY